MLPAVPFSLLLGEYFDFTHSVSSPPSPFKSSLAFADFPPRILLLTNREERERNGKPRHVWTEVGREPFTECLEERLAQMKEAQGEQNGFEKYCCWLWISLLMFEKILIRDCFILKSYLVAGVVFPWMLAPFRDRFIMDKWGSCRVRCRSVLLHSCCVLD